MDHRLVVNSLESSIKDFEPVPPGEKNPAGYPQTCLDRVFSFGTIPVGLVEAAMVK